MSIIFIKEEISMIVSISCVGNSACVENYNYEQALSEYHNSLNQEVFDIQQEYSDLGILISYKCSLDIWYIRSRKRGDKQMEYHLIALHEEGISPIMGEFGTSPSYPY